MIHKHLTHIGLSISAFALSGCVSVSTTEIVPAAEPTKVESTYRGSYIKRPTLVVHDMEKALSLYRDILGFQLGSLKQDPPDSYVFTAFNIPEGTIVRHATMDTDVEKRALSLVEVKEMKVPDDTGLRTSTILVNSNGRLDEILARLKAENYKILPSHPLGKTGTEVGFIDNDGHLIVVYHFPRP